ncbi:hypothetical protein [Thermococcus sp. GR6]|uniref:hypothetical protein n=1 Tax=Thermococcus sp. GR6 TaxID=1638256 RepID=UPI001430F93D|nr:hypothetical protein [Thermococcus sp. GR6]NJE43498.1 hypothetical protein [Thermococcus sp. GR6]
MWIQFERIITLKDEPQKLERFLSELRFVHYVKGPNKELWSYAPHFVKEHYEGYFYLVDFEGESFLIASTVPLKLPVIPSKITKFEGKREWVVFRVRLHFLDPTMRTISPHRVMNISLGSILVLLIGTGLLMWLRDFVTLIFVLAFWAAHILPGSSQEPIRIGQRIVVKKRGKATKVVDTVFALWMYWNISGQMLYQSFLKAYNQDPSGALGALAFIVLLFSPLVSLFLWIKRQGE